jgi:TPR repeat protein
MMKATFCGVLLLALSSGAEAESNQDQMDWGGAAYRRGDYVEAAAWFRKAADGENFIASDLLGNMYRDGRGVPQDYKEALALYRKAADIGYAPAQLDLGLMYFRGYGVPQDRVLAYMWLNLSAALDRNANGRELAAKYRSLVAAEMTSGEVAEAQRMAREWISK